LTAAKEIEASPKEPDGQIRSCSGKVAFFSPRSRYNDIRAVHKQAWTLHAAGYDVEVFVKNPSVDRYISIKMSRAGSSNGLLKRALIDTKRWFGICRSNAADVYILCNPDTIPLAFLLCMTGRKVIYSTQEDFSKRPLLRDISPAVLKPIVATTITLLERILARRLAAVIVTQEQQLTTLGGRTFLQPNAPLIDGPVIENIASVRSVSRQSGITLIYVGGITELRGIWKMLALVEQLNETMPCTLQIAGWICGKKLQRELFGHPSWRHVDFIGKVSHAEALGRIRDADIGLALLDSVADFPTSSITKLYEYMQFGTPFVASDFPAWRIPEECGEPGLYVNPDSSADIFDAAMHLAKDESLRAQMGATGAEFVAKKFNWSVYKKPFVEIVQAAHSDNIACNSK
jgi:glycosyltransferase involved in cell wall biosynthesis